LRETDIVYIRWIPFNLHINMRKLIAAILPCLLISALFAQSPVKRTLQPADVYRLPSIGSGRVSPDGKWVAYTLTVVDTAKDKRNTSIRMISWDGSQDLRVTNSTEGESRPRWSPDGKWLSFLSSRQESKGSQVWILDRRGGEAQRLTELKTGISDYEWSPDGKKLLLTISDFDADDTAKGKTTKPYVINRFQFKQDVSGYRYKKLYTHLYLFDVATKKIDTLTRGNFDEDDASFSPDGSKIAFTSNHSADPDQNENTDIFIMDAKAGATPRQLTSWLGSDVSPHWSPDGKWIAYTRSTSPANYLMYDQGVLAVISGDGGEPKLLSLKLDRPVQQPRWTKDGKSVLCIVSDDRQDYLAAFDFATGAMQKLAEGEKSYSAIEEAPGHDNSWVVALTDPQTPDEIYILEDGKPRRLTHQMDEFLAPLKLATVTGFQSKSADGTMVSGMLFRPADAPAGQKLPLVLYIHGGPVSQDDYGFDLSRQMLAGAGYAVAAVNYRGSNGRGLQFSQAITADWGNKEVMDLHGAVDYLVKQGIADPEKLGVGGWSYGGILTDYLITADNRFKAACSGAGTGFTLSLYGVDQYITQYQNEIGPPWKSMDKYIKISYPLLKADKIKTPTLFLSGEKDFNVPTAGSEQMYQALRTLGIPTELIIYPGQFHGLTVPSYQKDRYDRYISWYGKYLK